MVVGRLWRATVLFLLLFGLTIASSLPASPAESAFSTRLYLPLIGNGIQVTTDFGFELTQLTPSRGLTNLSRAVPNWLRRNGLRWSDVQPTRGAAYRWDSPAVRALEQELISASDLGSDLILVVQGSPAWATSPHTANCAPINPAEYDDFARFLAAAVTRYSAPPYNVRYWELGNEPDAPIIPGDAPYGCWGQPQDTYYGGRAYGEMLKVAYPAMKTANSQIQVMNGGLLLDKPYNPQTGEGRSARFLEGMLRAGAGNSFDLLAYHSYSFYNGSVDGTLGATDWKPEYLRTLLRQHNLSKPLINTEGALLCETVTTACRNAQAYSIVRMYVRTLSDGIEGLIWYIYDSDSFRNTALVEPNNPRTLRIAHKAYTHMHAMLADMPYIEAIGGMPAGTVGHRLGTDNREVWVIWADQPRNVLLSIGEPSEVKCTEWDGTAIACQPNGSGNLTLEARPGPRYIYLRY